jgi:hypothetical protein
MRGGRRGRGTSLHPEKELLRFKNVGDLLRTIESKIG